MGDPAEVIVQLMIAVFECADDRARNGEHKKLGVSSCHFGLVR